MTAITGTPFWIDPKVANNLELDLDEEAILDKSIFTTEFQTYIPARFVLRDAVLEVIEKINKAVAEQFTHSSSSERSVFLNTQMPSMREGSNLYFYEQYCGVPATPIALSSEQSSKTWLNQILQALSDKGYIKSQKISSLSGYEITLQAPSSSENSQQSPKIGERVGTFLWRMARISAVVIAVFALLAIGAIAGTVCLTVLYPKVMLTLFTLGIIGASGALIYSLTEQAKEMQLNAQEWD